MTYFVLDELPWGFRYPGVAYWKNKKISVYEGDALPTALKPYAAPDFSYAQFMEAELNGYVKPPLKPTVVFTPHEHQVEGGKAIANSWAAGWPSFLLGDGTGVGKTLTALVGATLIGKKLGFSPERKGKLLIVCPKAVIPQWRQTLRNYPSATSLYTPLVINYHQLNKLIEEPTKAKQAKKQRTKNRQTAQNGKPKFTFDAIIMDESQYAKGFPSSAMSLASATIGKLNEPYVKGRSPFIIFSTATPGSSPLHFSLFSGSLSLLLGAPEPVIPKQWGSFLEKSGFSVTRGKTGWNWATVPWFGKGSTDPMERRKFEQAEAKAKAQQRADAMRIGKALVSKGAPFIKRQPKDLAGWPEQQIIGLPLELTREQQPIYEEVWTRFRNWLKLNPKGGDPKGALVERLRYRQKASLLKVDSMADYIADWVEAGEQVFVSCEFLDTVNRLNELLTAKKIPVSLITGATEDREAERIRFQKGQSKVVICTPVAGISFHANEILPDGTRATPNPRVTVLFDVRQNPLDSIQALGRCHRDGENSRAYIPFFVSTVDEAVVESFVNKDTNMKLMTDSEDFLDGVFRRYR